MMIHRRFPLFPRRVGRIAGLALMAGLFLVHGANAVPLRAGAAKVDITSRDVPLNNDPLYVRALIVQSGAETLTIITLDAVAIGEIGYIKNDYLATVRSRLEKELHLLPARVLVNASHCHGVVRADVADLTVQAVKQAWANLVPVKAGAGVGREDRIMENRRLKLKSGREADVRHAYALPPDEEVVGVGPVDPEIGVLRLDREDGRTVAVVYNFAVHPIQGVPNGGNTADITGFSSKVIEENLGGGAIALFVQGCAGDVNPRFYKDVAHPRDAEPLGNLLGLSVLRAARPLPLSADSEFRVLNETLALPRANLAETIRQLEAEQEKLVQSLAGTSLNLKTFLSLTVTHGLSADYPTYYAHSYRQDEVLGRDDLKRLDAENRKNMAAYAQNIHIMEQLTRNRINLDLLKKHHAASNRPLDAEVMGVRIGKFVLVTFPGELTVRIGLNLKSASPHELTFIAGYTNGYLYYTPTAEQLKNVGGAQEDSDCQVAPEWQALFEAKALGILKRL